jgi:hypothetical protein
MPRGEYPNETPLASEIGQNCEPTRHQRSAWTNAGFVRPDEPESRVPPTGKPSDVG